MKISFFIEYNHLINKTLSPPLIFSFYNRLRKHSPEQALIWNWHLRTNGVSYITMEAKGKRTIIKEGSRVRLYYYIL